MSNQALSYFMFFVKTHYLGLYPRPFCQVATVPAIGLNPRDLYHLGYLDFGCSVSLSPTSSPSSSPLWRLSTVTWQMVKLWLNVCSQALAIASFEVDTFLKTTPFTSSRTASELPATSPFVSPGTVLGSASAPAENLLYSFRVCFSATMQTLWLLSLA